MRSQFIRKGEGLTMLEIPNGNYWIKQFDGNNWTYDAIMPDGITKGGFTINQKISKANLNCAYGCNMEMTLYLVEGGTLNPKILTLMNLCTIMAKPKIISFKTSSVYHLAGSLVRLEESKGTILCCFKNRK